MKTKLRFLWVLLALLLGGANGAWGADVTFYFSVNSEIEKDDISITGDGKYDNSNKVFSVSGNKTFTITSTGGNITAITFTFVSNAANRIGGNMTVSTDSTDPGTYSNSGPTTTGTWSGNAASVSFTTTESARITQMTVTYSSTTLTAVRNYTWNSWTEATYSTSDNIVGNLEFNGNTKSITTSASSFDFEGGGSTTSGNVHFKVEGNTEITVNYYNQDDSDRKIVININGTAYTDDDSSDGVFTYSNTGDAADVYVYSSKKRITVKSIQVSPGATQETTINIIDLCYEHRYYGQDLNRSVTGFDLTATGDIQSYNTGNPVNSSILIYRPGATVRIQPNSSNSSARITRVSFKGTGFPDGSGGYTATSITAYDGEGLEYIEFTNTTDNHEMHIESVTITTDRSMTSSKTTPTITFSPNSGSYEASSGEQNLGDLNTGTLRTYPTAFRLSYSITSNGTETTKDYHLGGKYLGITPGNTAGSETLTAAFTDGSTNPYFNNASATYGITITNPTSSFTGTYTTLTSTDLHEGVQSGSTYLIDGKERNLKGTYTFTSTSGTMDPGTEIDEVPGIKAIFGVTGESTNWTITSGGATTTASLSGRSSENNWIPSGGCFVRFKPYVNGILTLSGSFPADNSSSTNACAQEVIVSNNNTSVNWLPAPTSDATTFDLTVIAGRTYYVYCQKANMTVKAYTFRPAFIGVNAETGILNGTDISTTYKYAAPQTYFQANLSIAKDRYPKLIMPGENGGEGMVKFAGDRNIVNLYTNNNVDLLNDGTTIIKGTVLQDGSDRELFTYYYLQSNILKLLSIQKQANQDDDYTDATNIENEDYVEQSALQNGSLIFKFNHRISRLKVNDEVKERVYFKALGSNNAQEGAGNWLDITNGWTGIYNSSDNGFLKVNIGALIKGRTYLVRILSGAVCKEGSGNENIQNAEINLSFTVNNENEAQIKMIYPSGIATVGTSIVLATYKDGNVTDVVVDKNHIVTAVLTAQDGGKVAADENDNSESMSITGSFSGNHLIFKPTKTLRSNTTYVLTINPTQVYLEGTPQYSVTTLKEFIFTTGAIAGSEPIKSSTNPVENAIVSVRSGNIYFTFDQVVELEPFSEVYATPINGNEATANGKTGLDVTNFTDCSLKVSESDAKTIYFPYSTDQLKYDLYYRVVIPANTVIGTGGKPNSAPIELNFRMGKNPSASEVTASTFYPHTWDFCKFGNQSTVGTTAYNIINGSRDPGSGYRINSLYSGTEDDYTTYKTKNQSGYGFDQGANIYFNYKYAEGSATQDNMDEFEGIRISLVDTRSNRFEIRNVTSNGGTKNTDGTDKWIFRMNGNTHYMTLSNVPAGKLYMVVNSKLLGINSPNATFEENTAFIATTHDNNKRITNTNGLRKLVLNVSEAGDVVFCVGDFSCEKIGVAEDEKTFRSDYAESGETYATDRLTYDVRYDLLNAFTDHDVKAYYVSSMENNTADNTATITATEVTDKVAMANEGVMVLYQGEVSSSTTVPIFKTDVNSPATEADNQLKVISSGSTSLPSIGSDYYMYVLSNKGARSSGISFYRYTGSTFSDRAAYLEVPKSWVEPAPASGAGARAFRLVFQDEDGSETTAIRTIETAGVSEYFELDDNIYNLRGMRVEKPSKHGLYIKGGKKVYMK